jgi:type I restriction enzyme S subunit
MSKQNGHHGERVIDELRSLALPKGWIRTNIGEVGEVRLGRQRSPKNRSGKFPTKYIRAANLTWNGLDLTDVLDMDFRPEEQATYGLKAGDVLLSEASGSASEVGKPAVWNGELENCCFQNTVIRFRPRAVTSAFALVAFQHFARNRVFAQVSKGVGIHHLSADRFASMPFLLPPENEQCRIVAKIEELFSDLDAAVAALTRAKANLKRYRAAALKAAVEGKLTEKWRAEHPDIESASKLLGRILAERRQKWEAAQQAKFAAAGKPPPKDWRSKYAEPRPPDTTVLPELPEGWCWANLDQLTTFLRNGYFQSPSKVDHGTPILRINAVRPMRVDLAEVRFLDRIQGDADGYFVEDGDLLFTRYNGSVDLLGVAGMVRGCTEKILHPDKLIRVKLAERETLPKFVEIADNVGWSRRHMVRRARTTAGQTGISGNDVREMPVPLPPLAEQARGVEDVAEKLSQIEAAETVIDHGLVRASRLRQSILKQAFEGKLVPQDPRDEHAAVLFTRLCATLNGHPGKKSDADDRRRIQSQRTTGKAQRRRGSGQ